MNRSKSRYALTLSALVCSALLVGAECPMTPDMGNMNGNDNGNMNGNNNGNDNTNTGNFSPVVTDIEVRHDGRVAAGDGIIAYGTGAFSGVDYIELGDNAGRGIANSDNFRSSSFVVIGKKIILVGTDFSIRSSIPKTTPPKILLSPIFAFRTFLLVSSPRATFAATVCSSEP